MKNHRTHVKTMVTKTLAFAMGDYGFPILITAIVLFAVV